MSTSSDRATHRLRFATFAAVVALTFAIGPLAQAGAATPPSLSATAPLTSALPSFAPLVKKVMPAVVNISAQLKPGAQLSDEVGGGDQGQDQDQDQGQDQEQSGPDMGPTQGFPQSPFDQMLRHFYDQQGNQAPQRQQGTEIALGSGFIVDPTGYVVTNNHVVANAAKVTVIFQDGSKHAAKIIGTDTKTDLALLKIDAPKPLPYVSWGDSGSEQVGDWVIAVGNPFGLGGSVSPGTISARGRDIDAGPYDDFLQIDASINRGNSGGPTFNLDGQVVGINTAIYSPNGGSVGIGFAIPSDLAKPVIDQLRAHGSVERGWLGVQIQGVTPEIAKSLGLAQDEGALVASVTPDSPAAKAGFKQGDVILSFNGHAIEKMRDLPILVAETPANQSAAIQVWRSSGNTTLSATIAPMPANPQVAENSQAGGSSSTMGLQLSALDAGWRQRLHLGKDVKGVVVTQIADKSPLADLGLQRGDVIESINQQKVTTPDEAATALNAAKNDKQNDNVLLLLNRNGVDQYVALSLNDQDNG
jgi:serine protease Do